MDKIMVTCNESLPFDTVLYKADIQASIVYAKALEQRKLLSKVESSQIICGLQKVQEEWENGMSLWHYGAGRYLRVGEDEEEKEAGDDHEKSC